MILSLLSFILIDAWCLFVYVCNERKNEENEEEEEEEEDVCGLLYPENSKSKLAKTNDTHEDKRPKNKKSSSLFLHARAL